MKPTRLRPTKEQLLRENSELRVLLEEAREKLRAMGEGEERFRKISKRAATNATERRRTEAELRQSRARLAWVLEKTGVGMWLNELPLGNLNWDEQTKRLFFIPADVKPTADLFWSRLHPDDREPTRRAVEAALHDHTLYEIDHRAVHPDTGEIRWIRSAGQATYASDGTPTRFDGINYDITERKQAEAERQKFVSLADQSTEFIGICDLSFKPLYVNEAGWRLVGLDSLEQACAARVQDFFFPEDQPFITQEFFPRVLREGRADVEIRFRHFKTGDPLWMIYNVFHIQDAEGKPVGLATVSRNITERKRAEASLRESESFYRQTLKSIPGMVFTTRPDGYCDYQSQQWEEFTGVPMHEHLGDGWNKLLHPDDRPRAFAAWRAAVEDRAPYDLEYRVRRYDGEYEWFKVQGRPIRNAAGEIVRWFGTAMNIDDLVKARAALERSEGLYRAIGESIDYGIWICEPDGRNTYASESFLKLVGLTQEQCSSFGWGEVLHPDDAERTIAAWKECVRTGGTWDIEHRFRGVDGRWHPILARGMAVHDDTGKVLCWAGINLDISRLKHTEEQLRASLREKEVLLKEIHHRVKNNLQVISSLINLQADALNQPALRASLGDVRDRVRAMALVHEKLYQSASLAQLNFAEYAASLLHTLWRAHGKAAATIRLKLDMQPVEMPVDTAVPCGLILNELASNALKHAFRDRREGEVTVSLARDPASGRVSLRVSDNGVGLAPGMDWRQSPTLGLRLVQLLSQQLHGTVELGAGPGAEFRVVFPAPTASKQGP